MEEATIKTEGEDFMKPDSFKILKQKERIIFDKEAKEGVEGYTEIDLKTPLENVNKVKKTTNNNENSGDNT